MFIENRLTQLAMRLRNTQPAPLRLSLWDGRSFDFGPDPKVTIVVPQERSITAFRPEWRTPRPSRRDQSA